MLLTRSIYSVLLLYAPLIFIGPSPISALFISPPPQYRKEKLHKLNGTSRCCISLEDNNKQIVIEQISLNDTAELNCMSKFCIAMFYNHLDDGVAQSSVLSR